MRGKTWSRNSPRTAPYGMRPELVVIGWGNASTGHGGPISRAGRGPSKAFVKFVPANYSRFNVHVVSVDEHRTSKICSSCWSVDHKTQFSFPNAQGQCVKSHKLQVCKNPACSNVVDRDVSAAIAIMARLLHKVVPSAPASTLAEMNKGMRAAPLL